MGNVLLDQLATIIQGPVGYFWVRQRKLDSALPAYSVAGWGEGLLSNAIICLIVSMEPESQELLVKSDEWMTAALERARSGEIVHSEHDCYFNLAQCRWLAGPPAVLPDLSRALNFLNNHVTTATRQEFLDVFAWVFPRWLEMGMAEECVLAFEQFLPLYPPARRRHHTPAAMAYLLARQRLRQTLTPSEFTKVTDDFLTRQVPYMLGNGHYSDFARWVKLFTQADAGPAARAAVKEFAQRYTG